MVQVLGISNAFPSQLIKNTSQLSHISAFCHKNDAGNRGLGDGGGEEFCLMDLDTRDSDGNVREFVFCVSEQTSLRDLDTLAVGDHIQLVFHGPEEYAQTPWDMVFEQPERTTVPTAISVTRLRY